MATKTVLAKKTAPKKQAKPKQQVFRPVIVTTEHRGVFYGMASNTSEETIHLKDARMVIYFGTTRGLMQLAEEGPTSKSKISAKADIEVRKVTAVIEVSPAAQTKWQGIK